MLRRSSKTLTNIIERDILEIASKEKKDLEERDFKEALSKIKIHNRKYITNLSPIFDIEVKKKKK